MADPMDSRPKGISINADDPDAIYGPRGARVKGKDGIFHLVERQHPNGSLDFYTYHFTAWGARHAVRVYETTGRIAGLKP